MGSVEGLCWGNWTGKSFFKKKLPHGQQTFIMMPDEGVRELFLDLVWPQLLSFMINKKKNYRNN